MYKKLLALSLALVLCVCPVFAVSDVDNSYYSFEPVSYGSLGGRSLATLAATSGWSDTDHDYLNQIRLALTSKNTGTLLSYVVSIKDIVSNSYDKLFYIKQNTDYLPNMSTQLNHIADDSTSIKSSVNHIVDDSTSIKSSLGSIDSSNSSILSSLDTFRRTYWDIPWNASLLDYDSSGNLIIKSQVDFNFPTLFSQLAFSLTTTSVNPFSGERSLYSRIAQLQEVLASDDDKALADAQKPNRDQIEQDFVSGSSGKTSLGASDFGDLSSVGGSVKDSISLNGQSSISGFTGGLSDSDAAGQGWFSADTRDALDTVSPSSSSSSSRARRAP